MCHRLIVYFNLRLLIRRERRSRIGSEQNLDESKSSHFHSLEHFQKARLTLWLLIRRERRSRIGSEQNLDESKGSLFQSFEHFRKARVILRVLIVNTCVAKMRFTSGISEFLHNESGLSVAQFCVFSLNFVTVCYGAVVLDPRRN